MTKTISITEAYDIDGDLLDPVALTSDLGIDGTNDWPGRTEAILEVRNADIYEGCLLDLDDDLLAAYLMMARTEDHVFHPTISSCGATLAEV